MSKFVTAKLIKRSTEDGLVEVHEHVQLGKEYQVDLDSAKKVWLKNEVKNQRHVKEIIDVDNGQWLPLEMLELPVGAEVAIADLTGLAGKQWMVCLSGKQFPGVPSSLTECAECKERIWLSNGSKDAIKRDPLITPICPTCGAAKQKSTGDIEITILPETIAEITRFAANARNN